MSDVDPVFPPRPHDRRRRRRPGRPRVRPDAVSRPHRRAEHHEAGHSLHGRRGSGRRRLRLVGPARLLAPLGRAGSVADHDLGPASGHSDHGPSVPRRVSRHPSRGLLHRGEERRRRPGPGPASVGRLELRDQHGGRGNHAQLVRYPSQERLGRGRNPSSCCASIWRSATGRTARRWTEPSASSSTASIPTAAGPSAIRSATTPACTARPTTPATSPSTTTWPARTSSF